MHKTMIKYALSALALMLVCFFSVEIRSKADYDYGSGRSYYDALTDYDIELLSHDFSDGEVYSKYKFSSLPDDVTFIYYNTGVSSSILLVSSQSFSGSCHERAYLFNNRTRYDNVSFSSSFHSSSGLYYYQLSPYWARSNVEYLFGIDFVVSLSDFSDLSSVLIAFSNNNFDKFIDLRPKPDIEDFTYSPDLGYLSGLESRTRMYEITDDVADTFVINRIYRFGWDNKTTTGIDLWRSPYSSLQIQPKIHAFGSIKDKNGNVLYDLSGYIDKDIFDVSQITFQYSTDDLENDFSYFYSDSRIPLRGSVDLRFEVYFRLLATTSDGEYLRGGWLRARPNYTSNSWGLADNATVDVDAGVMTDLDGYVKDPNSIFGNGISSNISHGSGSTIQEAQNSSNPFIQEDAPTDLLYYINSTVAMITSVPQVIGVLFSFLPPWCLGLLALQFSFLGLIISIKFIRG